MKILSSDNYITASCIISDHVVYKNGSPLFENKDASPADFLLSVYRHFEINYPKFYKMDNLSKLGWLATEILLKDSSFKSKYSPEAIGVVLSNASSSLDTDIKYYDSVKEIPSPSLFVYTLPNIVIGEICIRHNIKGENAFFVFDDFNAVFIENYVSNLINNNILQSCICGWVELLDDQYKSVLFLVEKERSGQSILFTKENINKIYRLENG
ncbi:MAG TPA: hypothetical protein VK483_17045 [Chitinophagaceae bacterium]|nr:hypothetical protein [Chitinophagaceae bacterium]